MCLPYILCTNGDFYQKHSLKILGISNFSDRSCTIKYHSSVYILVQKYAYWKNHFVTPQGLLKNCSPISTMRINELEEGMFAYGTTPGSKREGTIGWVSRINHQKKKLESRTRMVARRHGMWATLLLPIRKRRMKKELQHVSCTFSLFSVNRAGLTKIVDPTEK